MSGLKDDKQPHGRDREFEYMEEKIKRVERSVEANSAIIVDLQVRVAQMEAIEPVGKDEFEPIRRLVWVFVSTVLAVVIVAILAVKTVLTKPQTKRLIGSNSSLPTGS